MEKKPYLSIVVASRNDAHSGSALKRMQIFVSLLLRQLSGTDMKSELVIVEWNPPPGRPGLAEVLRFPSVTSNVSVRLITVAREIHSRFPHSRVLGLYQFIAKNVGIRRARGDFILSTNMDILFSPDIIRFLAAESLDLNDMVRAIRCDVPAEIDAGWGMDEITAYCKRNAFRIYNPSGVTLPVKRGLASGFGLLPYFAEWFRKNIKQMHGHRLFTNACGDFTLLSRGKWHELRGYPEFPYHGVKIDGLLCYSAFFSGCREKLISGGYIYHLDHPGSWSSEKRGLELDLKVKRIPFVSRAEYAGYVELMNTTAKPVLFNNADWGLGKKNLNENKIG